MFTPFVRSCLVLGAVVGSLTTDSLAHATESARLQIPTQLVDGADDGEASLVPHCSKCRVVVVADEGSDGAGVLDVEYDDDQGDFVGTIELTILLTSGEYVRRTIDDVDLVCGETSAFDLEPGWSWDWDEDVSRLLVEFVASSG